jgi:uncharacterized cupin superfamily protein
MPVIHDLQALPQRRGTVYPAQFSGDVEGRIKRALTEPLGLTQFGVNLTVLEPGAKSSQRHWHALEDEFIYVLAGEITLVTNAGTEVLRAGMAAGFPKGDGDGHQLVNRGTAAATYLEVGTRSKDDDVVYPDIDMNGLKRGGTYRFFHRNGEPYP